MKQLLLLFLFVGIVVSLAYFTLTHPSRDQATRLETDLVGLRAKNDKLAGENTRLERRVMALRDDPRLAERKARETSGLVRPDELIFQFRRPGTPERKVRVTLRLSAKKLELAGREVEPARLSTALEELHTQLPGAQLDVVFDPSAGPLDRQRVKDIVASSSLKTTSQEP